MIDVHCHLLPGIDDGPETIEQSVSLCRLMVENGIRKAVVTPHIHLGRWNNTRESIRSAYELLVEALNKAGIDLELAMAAEVRIDAEILPLIATQSIPMLGQWHHEDKLYDVLLLELPHSRVPPGADKLVYWLMQRNILPMIAHPERNKDFQRNLEKLNPFIEAGCLFQLTAASVIGKFGGAAQDLSLWMLERKLATVIATDAHNEQGRRPMLAEAREFIADEYGKEYSDILCKCSPEKLVEKYF